LEEDSVFSVGGGVKNRARKIWLIKRSRNRNRLGGELRPLKCVTVVEREGEEPLKKKREKLVLDPGLTKKGGSIGHTPRSKNCGKGRKTFPLFMSGITGLKMKG